MRGEGNFQVELVANWVGSGFSEIGRKAGIKVSWGNFSLFRVGVLSVHFLAIV